MNFKITLLTSALLATSCQSSGPAPRAAPASPSPEPTAELPATLGAPGPVAAEVRPAATSPIQVGLTGPEAPSARSDLPLQLEINRVAWGELPLTYRITLPSGCSLVDGSLEGTVPLKQTGHMAFPLVIRVDEIPAGDVIATLTGRGEGFGYSGEAHYRFGRPDPKAPELHRDGPAATLRGRSLGPTIRVGENQPQK